MQTKKLIFLSVITRLPPEAGNLCKGVCDGTITEVMLYNYFEKIMNKESP